MVNKKIQKCRNECGTDIYVAEHEGKWKPFDAQTEQLHDCPKSPYNQKKAQGESYRTPKDSSLTDFERKTLADHQKIITLLESIVMGRAVPDGQEVDPDLEDESFG